MFVMLIKLAQKYSERFTNTQTMFKYNCNLITFSPEQYQFFSYQLLYESNKWECLRCYCCYNCFCLLFSFCSEAKNPIHLSYIIENIKKSAGHDSPVCVCYDGFIRLSLNKLSHHGDVNSNKVNIIEPHVSL